MQIGFDFSDSTYAGESVSVELEGFTVTATVYLDDDDTPPWKREDGHGPVTGWTSRGKSPGERVLNEDRHSKRFYDFAEAVKIARRDGWGCEGGRVKGESRRAYAARAAAADFERLRAWCNDEWQYVGVAVTIECEGVQLTGDYDHALWGIESDAGEYIGEVAAELAGEALDAAREKLEALTSCNAA